MKFRLLFIVLFIGSIAFAQNKGTLSGVLTDKESNNATLPFANIVIKGKGMSTSSDADGKYSINLEPGNYVVQFSFLGYENIEVPFTIVAGETTTVNKAMGSGSFQLTDVVVKARVSREKESALLIEQKNAVEIKQTIGAQEMARKGVSDVAAAVAKTTGITKQEGSGNIFVRGLGDRYNSTSMNGLPIPSNDPENKNINLEIFSTDIVELISIDKVYNSKLYGDYSGGNVDIISKEHKEKGSLKIQTGLNANTNALSQESLTFQNGYNKFGYNTISIPGNALTNYSFNSLGMKEYSPFGSSFGIAAGESFNIGSSGKISVFGTVSQSNEVNAKKDGIAKSGVTGSGVVYNDYKKYESFTYGTNTTGMLNLAYKINGENKINFNSVFVNTSTLKKEELSGTIIDIANDGNGLKRRNQYDQNKLWINQLLGEHHLNEKTKFNWGVSYNLVQGNEPDRNQNILRKESAGYVLSSISAADNHRYFQYLSENEIAANLSLDYKIGKKEDGKYKGKITFGYAGKSKTRDFEATQFNLKTNNLYTNTIVNPNDLDAFYNQANYSNGFFKITTFRGDYQNPKSLNPQTYNGEQFINAGFFNVDYVFGKLTTVFGVRAESIMQKIRWNTSLDPTGHKDELTKLAFLPSFTAKYELNEKQNLRLGLSKTYTLPQFKERALFVYEEATQAKIGNPDLYESDNYNLDLKWEFFPKSEEVLSFGTFGKYILNPINEVAINSSTNDISWVNSGDTGYALGAELELRKNIFKFDTEQNDRLSSGLNVSYLNTSQNLNSNKVKNETNYNVDFTNKTSKFTGASDLLLNGDITYSREWDNKEGNITATLAYSYFSDRLYALGSNQRGNQIDKAFGSLDFITKTKINKNLGLSLVIKNMLDPQINRIQESAIGDVSILSYSKGLAFSLGINYQF